MPIVLHVFWQWRAWFPCRTPLPLPQRTGHLKALPEHSSQWKHLYTSTQLETGPATPQRHGRLEALECYEITFRHSWHEALSPPRPAPVRPLVITVLALFSLQRESDALLWVQDKLPWKGFQEVCMPILSAWKQSCSLGAIGGRRLAPGMKLSAPSTKPHSQHRRLLMPARHPLECGRIPFRSGWCAGG